MIEGHGRDAAIERALAGLARVEASPARAEAVRRRMHERLTRVAHRRVRQRPPLIGRHRWAADAALAAAALLLYLAVVIHHAIGFFEH